MELYSEEKVILEKEGIRMVKTNSQKFQLSFSLQNQKNLSLPSILYFDLIQLIQEHNDSFYEKIEMKRVNEQEATLCLLLKPFFSHLGLSQKYLFLQIKRQPLNQCIKFHFDIKQNEKPESIPEEAELLPIDKILVVCEIIHERQINFSCSVLLSKNHQIPVYMEKMVAIILYKIINRLKQFIDNYRVLFHE